MENTTEHVKCLIIGSGPAGYTAAIYAARANMAPVMYQGLQPGGQLTITNDVENFPGYPDGIMGPEMMEDLKKQAARFGTDIRYGLATAVDFSGHPHRVTIDETKQITADAVIIATGASAKWLGLESEARLNGSGVSACAVCDGFFYRGKDVAIVGAGDTAAEEATYLANLCNKVYMLVRKGEMRASKIMQKRVLDNPKIEVLFDTATDEILGQFAVEGVRVKNLLTHETRELAVEGFFVAIGHEPNSKIFQPYLHHDEQGYLKTIPGSAKTNVDGVFACGDVQDYTYRQAVTAAGSGCMAALDAERYLAALGVH
ncbi:thioredoxin-disulfide reductase [Hymenobacter cellulosivorans]|uniref:Thioredoxin reductase n=1 Tax=Hymenobacter cellulosivorans TaxID=2932249 RepID=A0ABY4F5J3_9BACT|nr:thioredoxin-disulfide reductase [Hymenobacter cellulosivorans]UOQ51590.1 thioredoxin-disulfide reductase [Hymenobacter cellulosivorans]